MIVDLVRTTTADGHRLDGAFRLGERRPERVVDYDAVLMLHGVGGSFYTGNLLDTLSDRCVSAGLSVLRVNTRGHDSISISWGTMGPWRHGSAHETVDHCRHDVTAWLSFLEKRDYRRIVLLGHSLGAIKALYSQAFEPSPSVAAVIACSAPRLSYSAFMNGDSQPRFFTAVSTARDLVQQQRPEALFQADFPFPILITASGYLDKYGPEERYNILRFLDKVSCPAFVTYGQLELERGGIAFAGMPEAVQQRRRPDQRLDTTVIPNADHNYTNVQSQLADSLLGWLGAMSGE